MNYLFLVFSKFCLWLFSTVYTKMFCRRFLLDPEQIIKAKMKENYVEQVREKCQRKASAVILCAEKRKCPKKTLQCQQPVDFSLFMFGY